MQLGVAQLYSLFGITKPEVWNLLNEVVGVNTVKLVFTDPSGGVKTEITLQPVLHWFIISSTQHEASHLYFQKSVDSKVIYFFTVYEWTSIPYQVGYISGYTLLLELYVHYLDNWIIYEYTSTKVIYSCIISIYCIKCNLHNCMCYYNHKND